MDTARRRRWHDNYVDTSIDVSQLNHAWTAPNSYSQNSWGYDLAIDGVRVYRTERIGTSTTSGFGEYRIVARDINTVTKSGPRQFFHIRMKA